MNKTTEALKLAEEAAEFARNICLGMNWSTDLPDEALAAIRKSRAEQEPVMIVQVDAMGIPEITWDAFEDYDAGRYELYAAPADAKAIREALANARAEALEEAAKVCEKAMIQMNYSEAPYKQCAAAIRARGEK